MNSKHSNNLFQHWVDSTSKTVTIWHTSIRASKSPHHFLPLLLTLFFPHCKVWGKSHLLIHIRYWSISRYTCFQDEFIFKQGPAFIVLKRDSLSLVCTCACMHTHTHTHTHTLAGMIGTWHCTAAGQFGD